MTEPIVRYDDLWTKLTKETAGHRLVVIHDDGPYLHLRLQPDTDGVYDRFKHSDEIDVMLYPGMLTVSTGVGYSVSWVPVESLAWWRQGKSPDLDRLAEIDKDDVNLTVQRPACPHVIFDLNPDLWAAYLDEVRIDDATRQAGLQCRTMADALRFAYDSDCAGSDMPVEAGDLNLGFVKVLLLTRIVNLAYLRRVESATA